MRPRRHVLFTLPLAVLALVACGSSGSSSAGDSSSTSTLPSAKGKRCVAARGPLPSGAPEVAVQTGPPPTQLVVNDVTPGTGAAVAADSTIVADYIGVACSTGLIFDSSYSRGQPVTVSLSQVIPGWQQGLVGMKVGGTRLLGIPADLAYGSRSPGPEIAPDETLWFVVALHDVQAGTPPSS